VRQAGWSQNKGLLKRETHAARWGLLRGYSCKATKWVDFVMTDSTRRESCHFSKIIRLQNRVKRGIVEKWGQTQNFYRVGGTIKKRKLMKKFANLKPSTLVFPAATFSPQIVHPSHTKSPHLHPEFRKTPLKNAKTPRKKICKSKPANQKFTLINHLRRQMIVQRQKELLMIHHLVPPGRPVYLL
jgi:hypothetical protein